MSKEYAPSSRDSKRRVDDHDVWRKAIDEEVLFIAVRVRDNELGRAALASAFDGCERLGRHELPEPRVLEPRGAELLGRHHAANAFHVYRDKDLHRPLRVQERSHREEQRECNRETLLHWAQSWLVGTQNVPVLRARVSA